MSERPAVEPGAGGTHVVRRQVLELTVAGRDGVPGLQDDVHRVVHGRLTSVMDRVLSRHSGAGEVIRLDRLELDLGRLSGADLEAELVARTEAELEKVLGEELAALRRPAAGEPANGRVATALASRLERLRRFLETGRLPWWAPSAAGSDPEAVLGELLEAAPGEVVRMLRTAAPSAAGTLARRIVKQFAPATRRRILDALIAERTPSAASEARAAIDDWERFLGDAPAVLFGVERRAPRAFVVDRLLPLAVGAAAEPMGAPWVSARLAEALAEVGGGTVESVVRVLAGRARRALPSSSPVRLWLERREIPAGEVPERAAEGSRWAATQRAEPAEARRAGDEVAGTRDSPVGRPAADASPPADEAPRFATGPAAPGRPGGPAEEPPGAAVKARAQAEGSRPSSRDPAPEDETTPRVDMTLDRAPPERAADRGPAEPRSLLAADEALFVDDAGLVLAAPYLPAFLGKVGLVEKSAFVSPEARERGVLLLRYLATGTAAAGEHLLALDKLLCGWPLDEPVVREIEPTPEEEEETADLLSSIIDNWKVLKKISVDGLRASFLAREGRLTDADGGWKLEVRRAGYDVLLDQLPWGISLVLLPWMDRPLFVEW